GLAHGDVDGDGKPDILLADKKQFVWYRNGDWKRFVMVENLTEQDNVCIAARDLDGDGKVEVTVGAKWNPNETSDTTKSGSVHYLIRPKDPTQRWEAVELHHEPTIHRMRWAKSSNGDFYLVVVPLHGRGNKNGEGEGVKVIAYRFPVNPRDNWNTMIIDNAMHLTHNLTVEENAAKQTDLYIAGKEGVRVIEGSNVKAGAANAKKLASVELPAGEIRIGTIGSEKFLATIEPMHGVAVAVYVGQNATRKVLDYQLKEGHALATADLLGTGNDQVVAGWRSPNADNKVGIKLYVPKDKSGDQWDSYWIDENGMATEDLQVVDLNGDGKKDIIASGRSTKNLKIYWNKN
ncbi:MAG: FG-GAP repeat domain-containing protein, partial [Segetibacter sp.]